MNAVLKTNLFAKPNAEKARTAIELRTHRYDSPEQERLAKRVLEKHKVTLRNLAK